MPEGPEIRRQADMLAAALEGRVVTRCTFAFPELRAFGDELTGRKVNRVESRGKVMLIHFAHALTVYSHNQLYGRWYVCPAGKRPTTNRSLRLAIENRKRSALLYSASDIEVLTADDVRDHPFLSRLGPDILGGRTSPRVIATRLDEKPFRRRSLASLLLDQGFLAGMGNYLRSEVLFDARLDPDRKPIDLVDGERAALGRSIRRIARRTYRHRGVCTPIPSFRKYRRDGERRSEARFHVYGRVGKPCRACGNRIERVVRASRSLFHCPDCQK